MFRAAVVALWLASPLGLHGPAEDARFAAVYARVGDRLGDPLAAAYHEDNGNVKQDFERGYMLLAPDGAVYARGFDGTELMRSSFDGEAPAFSSVYRRLRDALGRSLGPAYPEDNGNLRQEFEGGYMLLAPDGSVYAHDTNGAELLAPAPEDSSEIALDTSIVPRGYSLLPGLDGEVEQCGEFVYRYFAAHGQGWPRYPTLGQPAEYIRGRSQRPEFPAFLNGGLVPPRAGDIIAGTGPPGSGIYHTALVWKVEKDAIWVYQANVPLRFDSSRWQDHVARLPMDRLDDGGYRIRPIDRAFSRFRADIGLTGWIHPLGDRRLPGAPD